MKTTNRPELFFLLICSVGPSAAFSQSAASPETAPTAASDELATIVVTAERRKENLQDVPLAVSVLTAEDAAKLGNNDNMSLPTQVPSLNTSRQITGFTVYLRGVGTISGPGNENAVATYVDDVYINGYAGTIAGFNNIDQVEVLNGPQGTLFGRNATGGVIHIVTKDPSQTPALDMQVGYGNYDTVSSSLYGTTGIGHNLAVDIAYFSRNQMSGYGHDLATGQQVFLGDEYGVRSKLKWTPSDATSVLLEADRYWTNYDYGANSNVVPGTLSIGNGTFAGDYNVNTVNQFTGGASGSSLRVDGETITVDHDFPWMTLRSVSAARYVTGLTTFDQDQGPENVTSAVFPNTVEQYTEEVRMTSPVGTQWGGRAFHWQAGAFVMKMNEALSPLGIEGSTLGGLAGFGGFSKSYTRSYAGFLDGTMEVATATNLTLGARITNDRIKNTSYSVLDFADGTNVSTAPLTQYANATQPTWRAILDHHFTEDLMTYASVSRGFKSGGFSLFSAGSAPTLPESLIAYTIGIKSEWFDHRFQANAEAFDYDYLHQQVSVIENGEAFGINAAKSRIYGLDVNLIEKAAADLTLRANLGYLHGRYLSFPGAPIYLQQPATCAPTPTRLPGALVPGDLQCSFDAAGYPTIRSPTFSGNVGFDYMVFRGEMGSIDWAVNYFHTTKFDWDPSGQFPEPAYGLLDTSLTWLSPTEKYSVRTWCSNCTNTYHDTFISESGPAQQRGPADPRLYGIRFGFHF